MSDMSDSEAPTGAAPEGPVPVECQTSKTELDKCVKEKSAEACKDLMEAFRSCVKAAEKS